MCQSVFPEILTQMMSKRSSDEMGRGLSKSRILNGKQSQEIVAKQQSQEIVTKQNLSSTNHLLTKRERIENGSVRDRFKLPGNIDTLLGDVEQSNHYLSEKSMTGMQPSLHFPKILNSMACNLLPFFFKASLIRLEKMITLF